MSTLIFGQKVVDFVDISNILNVAAKSHLEFVVIPLFHPRLRRDDLNISDTRQSAVTRSDLTLTSQQWISNVIGLLSEWIDLDSEAKNVLSSSMKAFKQEMSWATHLSLQVVILPPLKRILSPNYARSIKQILIDCEQSYQQYWIRIPFVIPLDCHNSCNNASNFEIPTDGWELWENVFNLSGRSHKLFIAIDLDEELPDDISVSLNRWKAEPIKAIIIPTRLFKRNSNGFPTLPKSFQTILLAFVNFKLHIIFSGKSNYDDGFISYIQYIKYLYSKSKKDLNEVEKFVSPYNDTLQAPLQPLMDNLESQTYEVFEKDPVKYYNYELAIVEALERLKKTRKSYIADLQSDFADQDSILETPMELFVIFIVGAGRGPLVQAALSASLTANVCIHVYAIEKNENAIITLRNRKLSELWTNVDIIASDIRAWKTSVIADVIVSELLGSWGDNELSPECLDGVQKYLNQKDGIMIPFSYTSFLRPISATRLWQGARDMLNGKGLDTPFVVKFDHFNAFCPSKPLFTFAHPNLNIPIDNSRY